jgi:hypothetical protein
VWRTGANETTEIKIYKDLKLGGETVKAGTYSLFSIPGEESGTIILNSDLDYWVNYSYKESADNYRFRVIPQLWRILLKPLQFNSQRKGKHQQR